LGDHRRKRRRGRRWNIRRFCSSRGRRRRRRRSGTKRRVQIEWTRIYLNISTNKN
jgi:hypothetical protein